MTFPDAVTYTIAELAADTLADAGPAAVRLMIEAWPTLADDVPAWDLVGLVALDIAERLFPDNSVVIHSGEPGEDRRAESTAVRDLATALAAWCTRRASSETFPLSERLSYDAAATELRRAIAALP